jgi:shikimate kinase
VSDWLRGVNLYLIGMMGSGKTTVGELLAAELDYQFFDTDAVIEQVAGQTISQIFAEAGETEFRNLETQVLAELCAYKRLTIATGGGIVLRQQNWSYLRHGIVVWLDVSIDQIHTRLKGDASRPLLQTDNPIEKLQSLMDQRQPLYKQADVRVEYMPGSTPNQVATQVLERIRQVIKA